ncbi:radical SAM protein [Mechercharimyces sp. CAU 1602]|uniref:radical SAM protein n=1 Tax=Mechercharimyces sp. CAU 1602 TaxID=2973933 RepID=UPI0021633646|nr:radical SAM protein [Mechercharimyces sp. CAU 1602]MCS1352622.1 radical SAM protein [Mechercharimyces sp. CAU 1602]
MNQIPYQKSMGGIVAMLPDGRVELLKPEFEDTITSLHNQDITITDIDFDSYILEESVVDLNKFHLSSPVIAFIEITNLCNLRCKHCYADSAVKRPNEMSTEEIFSLIDQLADMGVLQVFLTGGEVFSHKDAVPIIRHAMSKPFLTQVFTNGLLITEEKLAQLPPGVSFFISFDTADPERTIRGGMDFPKLRKRFEWMDKYGHSLRTAISVHRNNLDDVEEIFQWCVDNGYPRPQWLETHPIGRALLHPDILLQQEDIDKVFDIYKRCMDRFSQGPDDQDLSTADAEDEIYSVQTINFAQRLEEATGQEKCGRSVVYINSSGNTYPCSNCMSNGMYLGGNIKEDPFQLIWEDGFDDFRSITFDDFKSCQNCEIYQSDIWCQFRCPPLAKNVSKDELGCGATEYIKQFMLLTRGYWEERQKNELGLTLIGKRSEY